MSCIILDLYFSCSEDSLAAVHDVQSRLVGLSRAMEGCGALLDNERTVLLSLIVQRGVELLQQALLSPGDRAEGQRVLRDTLQVVYLMF